MSFRASLPWSSPGLVPLLRAPRDALQRGTILVETPAGMKSRARTVGLGRLHPLDVRADGGRLRRRGVRSARARGRAARDRIVHAFSYTEPGPAWSSSRSRWSPTPAAGDRPRGPAHDVRGRPGTGRSIASACWSSSIRRSPLELELPDRSHPRRRPPRRHGRHRRSARAPASRCRRPRPGRGARSSTIVVDYATELGAARRRVGPASRSSAAGPPLPVVHLGGRGARPAGGSSTPARGWSPNDPDDPTDWPCGALGLWKPDWPLPGRPRPIPSRASASVSSTAGSAGRPPRS